MPAPFSIEALPQLDDRDVTLLYEIVSTAQHSDQRPIRALFAAYGIVFNRNDAELDNGSKCFRFLSHAGTELAKEGNEGLVKRFRRLLSKSGIQLVLEDGNNDSQVGGSSSLGDHDGHIRSSSGSSSSAQDYYHSHDRKPIGSHRSRRRASFNDSNLDATWASRTVDQAIPAAYDDHQHRASSDGDRFLRHNLDRQHHQRSTSAARAEHTRHARGLVRPEPLLAWIDRPDRQRLLEMARHFLFETLCRQSLWTWHARAVQVKRRQQDLVHMARNYDNRMLLKQSLAQMRGATFDNRFWLQQERRAGRARDLFLLTKAFTHWAQTASDEVLRTNIARRHIIRTRYFNAWRDISVVNELKCRRVPLAKWFKRWRARLAVNDQALEQASNFRVAHVLQRSYWLWFWAFCEHKAPVWRDARLKASCLDKIRNRLANLRELDLASRGCHNFHSQKKTFARLQQRSSQFFGDGAMAIRFRAQSLTQRSLACLHRKTKFRPREVQFVVDYDIQLLAKAFTIWRDSTRACREAAYINNRRILSQAITLWNDRLREQTLRMKIDDRSTVQALYRWVLMERLALFLRVIHHRQKASMFGRLRERLVARQFQLQEATQLLHVNQARRLLQTKSALLHQRFRVDEQNSLTALEHYNAKALPKVLSVWNEKSAEARRLSRRASKVRFYCLAHTAIVRWREATVESQRRRRREAYAAVRRRQKTIIARHCLHRMFDRAAECQHLHVQAQEIISQRNRVAVRFCADNWILRTQQWRADEQAAEDIVDQRRSELALSALVLAYSDAAERYDRADAFVRDACERLASKLLRRMSDSVFRLRRHIDTAEAWQIRKFSQHRQDMLRYWALRANELRSARAGDDHDSPSRLPASRATESKSNQRVPATSNISIDRRQTHSTRSLFARPAAGDQSDIDLTTVSAPGYMRTPSRRAARNKARSRAAPPRTAEARTTDAFPPLDFGSSVLASTTPAPLAPGSHNDMEALTPQVTPFQRKLRAGGYNQAASATPLSARRDGPFGVGVGGALPRNNAVNTPFGGAAGALLRSTGRSVRFGRTVVDADSGDEEEDLVGSPARSAR